MAVETQVRDHTACMELREFQDWLVAKGILVRASEIVGLQLLDGKKLTSTESRLADSLNTNLGYLVTASRLLQSLTISYDNQLSRHILRTNLSRMKLKMTEPWQIFNVPNLGWGLNIQRFDLNCIETNILYLIWSGEDTPSLQALSQSLYGYNDHGAIHSTKNSLNRLNSKIRGQSFKVGPVDGCGSPYGIIEN
jgi:hypothetical protein